EVLLGKPPRMTRQATRVKAAGTAFDLQAVDLREATSRVLRLPTVADKTFLITIGDRTVTGLVARDQMVGPGRVAVAPPPAPPPSYAAHTGGAMARGDRPPLALLDAAASARMAVA